MDRLDALVLDARQRQALVCVRALGRSGLRVGAVECTTEAPAFSSRWCSLRAVVPDFAEDSRAYVNALLGLLERYPTSVLIPLHDGSIEALRAHRTEIERWAALALASESALQTVVSKARTLEIATPLGLEVPKSLAISDSGEVREALREIGYPAVIKPVQSWVQRAGTGTRVACQSVLNDYEAERAVERLLSRGGGVIVQEWLSGKRENINLFYAGGRIWARFAQVAHRMYPPLGGASVLRESVPLPPDATDAAERFVRFIDLEGYSEIEFRRNRAGRPVLMEVNPRLSASIELAVKAGVDFPGLIYKWTSGQPLQETRSYRQGLRMRWLGGDLAHLRATLNSQGRPDVLPAGRALRRFVTDFVRPTAYDYLDVQDSTPAITAGLAMMRQVAGRVARRLLRSFRLRKQEGFEPFLQPR